MLVQACNWLSAPPAQAPGDRTAQGKQRHSRADERHHIIPERCEDQPARKTARGRREAYEQVIEALRPRSLERSKLIGKQR